MRVGQYIYGPDGWTIVAGEDAAAPDLIIVLASPDLPDTTHALDSLRDRCPHANIIGCTTGGEILGDEALDGYITATSIGFAKSHVHVHSCQLSDRRESFDVGRRIASALNAPAIRGVMLLSDGLDTNGAMLIRGLRDVLPEDVPVFGGLAADGSDFVVTRVAGNGPMRSGGVVAAGFYGAALEIRNTTANGCRPVGEPIPVTNASGSVVYEIAGRPALDVLLESTGYNAENGIGQFITRPLWFFEPKKRDTGVVRSVIGIDEVRGNLIVAGDVPQNAMCQLMESGTEGLIAAAEQAARECGKLPMGALAIVVSCIGRKLTPGHERKAELEAVSRILGNPLQSGFYAYGEFGRNVTTNQNDFMNHGISLTAIWERQ